MILIIWEEIPENTSLYLVEPESPEQEAMILAAHNNFVNCTGSENERGAIWLSDLLEKSIPDFDSTSAGKAPLTIPAGCKVIVSGFML